MNETVELPSSASVNDQDARLRNEARASASWEVMRRPQDKGHFDRRVTAARTALRKLESDLARLAAESTEATHHEVPQQSALLDLRAHARMLRAALGAVADAPRAIALLPRIVSGEIAEEPRVARIATEYLRAVDGAFAGPTICLFVRELQQHDPLTVNELWRIAPFLKFALLELLLAEAGALLRAPESAHPAKIAVHLKSLRTVTNTDWAFLIEPLIVLDATLRQDPAQTYAAMDFESRELYRKRISFVSYYSDCNELQVAALALELARAGETDSGDGPRMQRRRMHVGYYLVGEGFPKLAQRIGFHPPLKDRMRRSIHENGEDFYLTAIQSFTVIVIASILFPILPHSSGFIGLLVAFVFLAAPAMQDAIDLVNHFVTALFDPEPLPKLDFSNGIPAEYSTLVVVPSLLLDEEQVHELVAGLEVRFLANRDPHLHFALLSDLRDSVSEPHENDSHPLVELAIRLVDELNAKYAASHDGAFLLLHRHRIFNHRQGVWMGWERKRGKLLDLNNLLTGEFDAFPIKAGRLDVLRNARYVLTLDTDTQLPRGVASRLVGTMAHPLNQAIVHPKLRIVTAGYGILQPRIGIAVQSASRSRLATIYSGQNGFDIYTRAISDAYQDLFGEGIFTGKGLYEIETLHTVLNHRFPRNALLSHDLIEGAYARAGQVTDVELIDDYPSHYSAYSRRKHRWVRGDWQIAPWIFGRVPDESGRYGPNPISSVSRWKIFDNLRRSLLDPALFFLFVAGWFGLPGGPLYWTFVPFVLLLFPELVQLGIAFASSLVSERKQSMGEALANAGHGALVALLNLVFLPHQMLLAFDAIIRSLVRLFISGERLLEWETAAQAESSATRSTPVDRYLAWTPLVSAGLAGLVYLLAPQHDAIFYAAPILLMWSLAGPLTVWLSRPPQEQNQRLGSADKVYLLTHALRVWRYFHEFGAEKHNYLIPDNVEEEGLFEAARVSPTNLGLLLNARQAACEFGFLTVPEFIALTRRSLETIERLDKFRGHLYNWYDTQTLAPLGDAPFISSVDSGNFVASLHTLRAGTLDLLEQPLFAPQLLNGLRAYWELLQEKGKPVVALPPLPKHTATVTQWIAWLPSAEAALVAAAAAANAKLSVNQKTDRWWLNEALSRIRALRTLLRNWMPWMLPHYEGLFASLSIAVDPNAPQLSLEEMLTFSAELDAHVADAAEKVHEPALRALVQEFRALLAGAKRNLHGLVEELRSIAAQSGQLADEAGFAFLVNPDRQILSIGFDVRKNAVHEACYDMLASEARMATFLAVARGDLRQESWFKLARDFAQAFGHFLLLSWSGTMFEYLMPALWMRSFPNTLISRTQSACVAVQREFARALSIPWGISESGSSRKDDAGHYHYHAYGVPQIALWVEASAGPVVAPYATFLALGVDCCEALYNLRRMESMGWVGAYGFYESADYIASPRKPALTREWMAHHQGMALLAVVNLLRDNVVQRWFHANPLVQSAELLLHETPTSKGAMKARLKELAPEPAD